GKIDRQLELLQRAPGTDLCVTHFQNFWDTEVADEEARYRDHPLSRPAAGYMVSTLMAPRRTFVRFGGFCDAGNPSDTAWFARAAGKGAALHVLPDVLVRRRLHRANDSRLHNRSLEGLFDLIRARRREEA